MIDSLGGGLSKVTDDGGVGVEEIVTGHTRLARNTSWDDNDVSALESVLQAVVVGSVTLDLKNTITVSATSFPPLPKRSTLTVELVLMWLK